MFTKTDEERYMMNGVKVLLTILILTTLILADSFVVQSFTVDHSDISAVKNARRDVNNDYCAILKVSTDLTGLKFFSSQLEEAVQKQGEYWIYLSPGTQHLQIQKTGFIPLQYTIEDNIQSSRVYRMVLTNKDKIGLSAIENTVQLAFRFNTSDIYVSYNNLAPIQTRGTSTSIKLSPGEYNFKFIKQGYLDKTQTISLDQDRIVNIDLEPGQSQTRMVFGGMVTITSEPSDADVYINGQMVGKTLFVGELMPGQYNLSLQKKLYHTHVSTFEVKEEQSLSVPTIQLKPKFAYIAVTTNPSDAKIYLDNKSLGNAPIQRQQIESGTHSLRIEKALYHTQEHRINLQDGDDEALKYDLQPAFGTLNINSDPSGADVYIDGTKVGTTPYTNPTIASGQYTVKVTKDKWYPAEETIEVNDGETTSKILMLSQNFGTLSITATGSDIYLNSRKVGTNTYKEQLQPGQYNLKAVRDKHYDATQQIYLKIGDTQNITLAPEPKMASLSVVSMPADRTMGSRIFVNNEEVPDKTTPAILPLLIGDYDITLKHRNFLEMTQHVTLKEGQREKLTFNLQTYEGSRLAKKNFWKRQKWLGFATSALIAGAGYYCNMQVDASYDDYQAAKISQDAANARNSIDQFSQYRDISYSVSVAPLLYGFYSWIKQGIYNK